MAGAGDRGHTLCETLVVLAISGLLAGVALPSLSGIWERSRIKGATREIATLLRSTRSSAIARGRGVGMVFERASGGWGYALYADGNGDGIRMSDIAAGTDVPLLPPQRLGARWAGVDFGFIDLPRVRKIPPSTGWVASLSDPIQFGATDIVSFSPNGDSSSGTIYLSDARSQMTAIVIYGATARVRLFRYDVTHEEWVPS